MYWVTADKKLSKLITKSHKPIKSVFTASFFVWHWHGHQTEAQNNYHSCNKSALMRKGGKKAQTESSLTHQAGGAGTCKCNQPNLETAPTLQLSNTSQEFNTQLIKRLFQLWSFFLISIDWNPVSVWCCVMMLSAVIVLWCMVVSQYHVTDKSPSSWVTWQ